MVNHVFICYARKDATFVLHLATQLKARGVPVWLDQWDIPLSADWNQAIDEASERCAHFLIVLSPAAIRSREVRGELRLALDENKPARVTTNAKGTTPTWQKQPTPSTPTPRDFSPAPLSSC